MLASPTRGRPRWPSLDSNRRYTDMPFDLSVTKLLLLGLIAMLVFGPDKLPQVARDAARMLRQLRGFAQQARSDLKSELGDTVGDFDIADLNPRTFVRKHLFEDDAD